MSAQWLRADVTAVLVMLLLIAGGVLSPVQTFSAFGQPVIIIMAAIFVIGAAMVETGVATLIANQMLRFGGSGETTLILMVILVAGAMTAVLDGLLVVAVLMPAVLRLARQAGLSPARLLLPLATAATVGNQLTLIGAPSNLVVSDVLVSHGYAPLGIFSMTGHGLASVGIILAWFLLPGRRLLGTAAALEAARPSLADVQHGFQLQHRLYRLRVRAASDLTARTLAESGLSARHKLNVIAVRAVNGKLRAARPEWVLEQDDVLVVEGDSASVLRAASRHNLEPKGLVSLEEFNRLEDDTLRLAEVMVPFRSTLIGQTLAQLNFRDLYGLNVLAVQRQGAVTRASLSDLRLLSGDTLLVQGHLADIRRVGHNLNLALVTDLAPQPGDLISGKAGRTLAILGAMLVVVVLGLVSLTTASMAAAAALVLTGCLAADKAYKSINVSLLVLVGGMLPLTDALQQTGAADILAGFMLHISRNFGPLGGLLLLYLLTGVITQVIANPVAAALVTPIAINMAVAHGVSPYPFAIGIAFAANAAYVTPLTDGDNIFVREPGRYTMRDYVINGLPIFVLQTAVLMGMFAVSLY
jgi:di/tricarboxylate transporter